MKEYVIRRVAPLGVTCIVINGARLYSLTHILYHSPSGFECGHGGSGPADLALSILADHLDQVRPVHELASLWELSFAAHQDFAWQFLAPMNPDGGTLTAIEIEAWLTMWKTEHARRGHRHQTPLQESTDA